MRRRHRQSRTQTQTQPNHERWLITYADLITLLMVFFVVMYAMSKIDQGKFDSLTVSLNQALQPSNRIQLENMGPTGILLNQNRTQTPASKEQEQQTFEEIKQKVESYIRQEGLTDQLNVIETPRGIQITLNDAALFASGQADLKPDAKRILGGLAPFLKLTGNRVAIEGHTDNLPIQTSRFPSNWELSSQRAINVLHFFETQGVAPGRMHAVGYADTLPLLKNDTPENRAANRRVNLVFLRQFPTDSISPLDSIEPAIQ